MTGLAGIIASKVTKLLLAEGNSVVGVENPNKAFDVRLKDGQQPRPHSRYG